jgi:hypothetical protein
VDVADFAGQLKAFKEHFNMDQRLRELLPLAPSVHNMLDSMIQVLSKQQISYMTKDPTIRKPKLHAKTNLFISAEAVHGLVAQPEFTTVLRSYIQQRVAQASSHGDIRSVREKAEEFLNVARDWMENYMEKLRPEEQDRLVAYFKVGTMNQNYRSKVFDGEAVVLLSGGYSIYGLMDMVFRIGLTEPIDSLETLEKHLPQYSGLKRKIGRIIRTTL